VPNREKPDELASNYSAAYTGPITIGQTLSLTFYSAGKTPREFADTKRLDIILTGINPQDETLTFTVNKFTALYPYEPMYTEHYALSKSDGYLPLKVCDYAMCYSAGAKISVTDFTSSPSVPIVAEVDRDHFDFEMKILEPTSVREPLDALPKRTEGIAILGSSVYLPLARRPSDEVHADIYDHLGRLIGRRDGIGQELEWDPVRGLRIDLDFGSPLASGVYFVRVSDGRTPSIGVFPLLKD